MTPPAGSEAAPGRAPRHLWDYWRIIWEGRRILLTVLGVTLAVAILGTLLMPKRYRSEAQVEIQLTQAVVLGAVTERSASRGFFDVDREFKTEFVRIRTARLLQKAIDEKDLLTQVPDLARIKEPAQLLKRFLTIDRLGQTNVAAIGVSWGDAKEAAILANAIAETYVADELESRVAEIDERIARLRGSLAEKSGVRREVLERELALIRGGREIDELLTLSTMKDHPTLEKLSENLREAKSEMASAGGNYGPAHPSYLAAASRLREAERQVDDAVKAAIADLEIELRTLGGDPASIAPSTAAIGSLQQESDEKLEKDLQARVAEEEVLKRTLQPKAKVIDPALPARKASSPKWSLNLMLALVVGLGFGGGLIFFKDYLDKSVKTIDDVESDLELPLLAVVPLLPDPQAPDKIAKEAYQTLRTGLLFASDGRKDNILLVTSSGPLEGKTSVVVNLARALASAGESVIVLDGDLRRAQVTKALGGSRSKGLSSYLADTSAKAWRDVVTEAAPNLHLLSTGPLPPNPVDLLGMQRFRDLLQELRSAYKWVLIDSPPVSSVSDPVLLAALSQMVLVVLRHDQTDKDVARRALQRLSGVGARIVGAVLNGVDMEAAYNREYYYGRFFYGSDYAEEGMKPGTEPAAGLAGKVRKMLK